MPVFEMICLEKRFAGIVAVHYLSLAVESASTR